MDEVFVVEDDGTGRAAAAAGLAIAVLGDEPLTPPARVTATIRDTDNRPISRDDYASHLEARAELGRTEARLALLSEDEAQAVAALLDELAGVYRGEALGQLARSLAVRVYDRLGL